MANKITGLIDVFVNGVMVLNKSGATATGVGISGEPAVEVKEVLGDGGLHGVVEEPVVATCEFTHTDRSDISLSDLCKIKGDGTVQFRARNGGKVYTLPNAYCTRNLTITGGEGETPMKFIGSFWIEGTQ